MTSLNHYIRIYSMYPLLNMHPLSSSHSHAHTDKLDAVGSFRRRKRRLPSEAEEELSLTEYLRRKQEEEENAGPKRKRVREL